LASEIEAIMQINVKGVFDITELLSRTNIMLAVAAD